MGDQGYKPRNMAKASKLNTKSNAFLDPQYQNLPITTQVDSRAALRDSVVRPGVGGQAKWDSGTSPVAGEVPQNFVQKLIPYTSKDRHYRNRTEVLKTHGDIVPGIGKAYADSAYFEWAQEKREIAMWQEFQQFIMSQINLGTPEARAYWEKRFPEYCEAAYEQIEKQKELELKLDNIRVRGYKTMDDMWLKFLYDKKLIGSFEGKDRLNTADFWLLPEYESMYGQIGLPMSQPEGVMPEAPTPAVITNRPKQVQSVPENPGTYPMGRTRPVPAPPGP